LQEILRLANPPEFAGATIEHDVAGRREVLGPQPSGSCNGFEMQSVCVGEVRMNRYQLAKIVRWAGTFRSRKRMQKLIFLLQAAGCPLDVEYDLHHYGPYSQDVAQLTDELVREKLLGETAEPHPYGQQYSYVLSEDASRQIVEYEAGPGGSVSAEEMAKFHSLARKLYDTDLKELEVAATIVFFRKQGVDWAAAVEKTCQFKNLPGDTPFLEKCKALANEIVD